MIVGGWHALAAVETVWKCEGIPDALALAGVLPDGHIAITNVCGAKSEMYDWNLMWVSTGPNRDRHDVRTELSTPAEIFSPNILPEARLLGQIAEVLWNDTFAGVLTPAVPLAIFCGSTP